MRSEVTRLGYVRVRPHFVLLFMAMINYTLLETIAVSLNLEQGLKANAADTVQIIPNPQPTGGFRNPSLLHSLTAHSGRVKSLTFSPDGRTLVSGGAYNDGVIRLWNPTTGKRVGTINKAQKTAVESLVISPDGQTLVSSGADNIINLWNLKNNRFTRSFVGHTASVMSLAVSSDSKVLVSGALDGIRVWDLLQQRPLATLVRFDNRIYTLAMSSDGQTLASGDTRGVIKLWNLRTGELIRGFTAHTGIVTDITFTPDGQNLISSSSDRTVKVWNLPSEQLTRTLTGHNNWVNAIALNRDGQTLASAGRDGIKLWDLYTGELLNTLVGHSDWVSAIAFSPDGQVLASGGFDGKVNVWVNPSVTVRK